MRNSYKILIISCLLFLVAFLCGCNESPEWVELTQKHKYVKTPYVDYSISNIPEFVNDITQCMDTDKQYVLPDGYLYKYEPVASYSAVNQLVISEDEYGAIFNQCGFLDNARIRGVLEIGENEGGFVTGFIPINVGDIIYFSGNCFQTQFESAHVMHIALYDAEKKVVTSVSLLNAFEAIFSAVSTNDDGSVSAIKLNEEVNPDNIKYVRFSLVGSGSDQIISVNEELIPVYQNHEWVKAEKYISENWYNEICKSIETINGINLSDESNLIKFIFASDIHLEPGAVNSYTENIGKICAEIMRSAEMPFFITGGDNCTQSSGYMPDVFEGNVKDLLNQLSPIPLKNIMMSVGNHDGATGYCEEYGEIGYYRYQLNNSQRSSVFFDWQRETNQQKHFDSDGTYFYMDDSSTKTRYIILNCFWNEWEGNDDGLVTDILHSFNQYAIFGQKQLDWFAKEALDMPPGYGAIIVTHFAPDAKDFELFKGIVDAFSNRSVYEGVFDGGAEWLNSSVSVNYTDCFGEIIAVFQGHRHTDAFYDQFDNVPTINITTTGAYWAVKDEDAEVRVKGTASEFAVDAVIIDRGARKIYLIRVGAGEDRMISY